MKNRQILVSFHVYIDEKYSTKKRALRRACLCNIGNGSSHKAADHTFHILIIHNDGNRIAGVALFQRSVDQRGQILFLYHIKFIRNIHICIQFFDCLNKLNGFIRL